MPNLAARTLVTRQSDVVALVVPEPNQRIFTDPFFGSAIAGMVDALSGTSKQLVLAMRSPQDGGDSLRRYLSQSQMDGVVILSHHESDDFASILSARGIPMVFVGRPPSGSHVPYVDVDNVEGGRLAARHVLEGGASRPATISGPLDMPAAIDRLTGWREVLRDAGVAEVAWREGDFTPQSGATLASAMLEEHPEIDALFVASDPMAIAAVGALRHLGRRVPHDVRVVGFDDILAGRGMSPPLTTVTNPAQLMARTATEGLLAQIDGEAAPAPVVLTPELIVRASS